MNMAIVKQLIWKDWYLNRAGILVSLIGGMATLGVVAAARGAQIAVILGVIVVVTILIGMGSMVMMSPAMERKAQTLPFVMSLPINYLEYTTAKIVGCLLIFLVLWTGLVVDVAATIWLAPGFPHGLIPFALIMSVEILMSTCLVTSVAVITESQNWTVGITQLGVLSLNGLGWWFASLPGMRGTLTSATIRWSGTATVLLTAEIAAIALMIAITFFVQARKKDFV
jgi:ABC-2 type transport system permease protein